MLYDIHNLHVASFVFECRVNGVSPSYFHEYFKLISNKHTIRTHQSTMGNLFLEKCNTDQYGIRSIQFYGVILWNSIPPEIRNWTSTACFRTKLKKHYTSYILCEIINLTSESVFCHWIINYFLLSDYHTDIFFCCTYIWCNLMLADANL